MEITIINGSPKRDKSTSDLLMEYLISQINDNNEIELHNIKNDTFTERQFEKVQNSDVLIFAFPLYVDSVPSHVLKLLIELEKRNFATKNIAVYCVINNGFFEGHQNRIAITQMKNWCRSCGFIWGQAVGIGAGEMLPFLKDIPMGHGPNKNIGSALKCLSKNILSKSAGQDILVSPNWPRLLWKIQSSFSVWYPRAKSNGLTRKELYRRIQ